MEHEIPFGNSNRENGTTFLDFPLFLRIFQWDEPTTRVPFTAEPEIPEILSKWKAPFEYYEFPKRNQKKAKGQRKKISSYTLWVPFVSRKVMFGKKSARHKTIFQRGAESSEESSGDDTCGLNLLLNQEPFVDLVLAIDAGVKSFREFSDDNDYSNSSFNQPSIVVKSSGESSDDDNESSNSSSFGNKESPVAMSDLDSECEISHEGHDDIQHDCSNADLQSGVWSDESSSVTSGDASCDQENDVEEDSDSPGELDQNAALPLYEGRVDRPTYTGSDVPAQDMFDNQFAKAPVPSAPPTDMFAQYSGYENTRFGSSFVPPPPPYVPPPSSEMPEQLFQQSTAISDDQARDAMLQFVSEHCCYGKTPAQEMVIKDIVPSSAYHYSLASFCEPRKTEWQYEPYRGQPIDSPVNGPAPLPWNIPAQPQQMFSDFQTKLEVPHTANIKPCHDCLAVGYIRCYKCCGRGRLRCSRCQGSGQVQEGMEQVQCNMCFARGWKMCYVCNGHGRVKCSTCMGNAQLKTFIELTVKWKNNVSHHVVGRTEQLPSELIINSEGTEIFSQELPRVWPISTFFDQQVNMGSKRLVEEHSNKWPGKRILMQRHVLRAVPVSEVHYQWNDFARRFWVFGLNHKVYAPDYPQKCCCGCSIL